MRIGVRTIGISPASFTKQKIPGPKKRVLCTNPPFINGMRTMQNQFGRSTRKMIANTIINNKDVFNDAIAGGDFNTEPETDSDSDWESDEDPASDDELVIDEVEELYYELQPAEGAGLGPIVCPKRHRKERLQRCLLRRLQKRSAEP